MFAAVKKALETQFATVWQAQLPAANWGPYGSSGLVRGDGQSVNQALGFAQTNLLGLHEVTNAIAYNAGRHERRQGVFCIACLGPRNEAGKTAYAYADIAKLALQWFIISGVTAIGYPAGVTVRVDEVAVRQRGEIGNFFEVDVLVDITAEGWFVPV